MSPPSRRDPKAGQFFRPPPAGGGAKKPVRFRRARAGERAAASARRGLTSVFRSAAGGQDATPDAPDAYRNNAHWLYPGEAGPSNHVAYLDAASLYPSSGESPTPRPPPARQGRGARAGPPVDCPAGEPSR